MGQSCLVRIYRPRAFIGGTGYFRVLIDGVDCGELWSKQVKVFEVSPGHHRLGLRQGFVIRSKVMDFSVQPGEVAEFACAQIATALGRTGLHPATPEESLAMRELVPPSPTPRDLSTPE